MKEIKVVELYKIIVLIIKLLKLINPNLILITRITKMKMIQKLRILINNRYKFYRIVNLH